MALFPVAILAGGLATRLRPLTEKIPKALLEVAGEPFINHQLRQLQQQGVRQVVLCTGYLGEMLRDHVGNGKNFGLEVQYSPDGPKLLGTGGALKQALSLLGDAFFVLYGDSYLTCSFAAVQEAFKQSQSPALMTVLHNAGQWDTSNVVYMDNKIVLYDKKITSPKMQHIDYGLGVLAAKSLTAHGDTFDLAQVYTPLSQQGMLAGFEVSERFYEIGSLQGIKETEAFLRESPVSCEVRQ